MSCKLTGQSKGQAGLNWLGLVTISLAGGGGGGELRASSAVAKRLLQHTPRPSGVEWGAHSLPRPLFMHHLQRHNLHGKSN